MDVTAIRRAITDLDLAYVADMQALSAATWQQPSDCEGWTISAALIHLAQVADFLSDSMVRGRAGDPGPPPLVVAEGIQAWRAVRGERQQAALKQSPAELLAWYGETTGALYAQFDLIPTADPAAQGWHPVGARPLAWIQDQWLFELALHDWDIRVALDPDAEVRTVSQNAFVRTVPGRIGRGFGGADDPKLAGTYRIEVHADEPMGVTIQVGGGALDIVDEGEANAPDATIRTDASAFGLVTTNRRPVERYQAAGRWQSSGDTARADAFARAFKSY